MRRTSTATSRPICSPPSCSSKACLSCQPWHWFGWSGSARGNREKQPVFKCRPRTTIGARPIWGAVAAATALCECRQNHPHQRGINDSATKAKTMARSIKFEPSVQPGNKRLLRGCALEPGERDERSRIRTIAGCRESGDCARPPRRLLEQPADVRSAVESRQRQWAGLAAASVSGRLVRYLLITGRESPTAKERLK